MAPLPVLYIFFGLIATGKSTLAAAWAAQRRLNHYNSDVVRKQLAGLPLTATRRDGVEQGIYTPEYNRRTYDQLLYLGEKELQAGRSVVLDASYLDRGERERVVALAHRLEVEFTFILCTCSEQVKAQRLAIRVRDPQAVSEGRWEILLRQREKFQPPTELPAVRLLTIDTDQPIPALLATLARQLLNSPGAEA